MPLELLRMAEEQGVLVEFWDFSPPVEGIYISEPGTPPVIGLSNSIRTRAHFRCILAEELGHHFTTVGSCLPASHFLYSDRLEISRAEHRALRWAARYLMPLDKLQRALWHGARETWALAELFCVTEEMVRFRLGLPETQEKLIG